METSNTILGSIEYRTAADGWPARSREEFTLYSAAIDRLAAEAIVSIDEMIVGGVFV